MNQRTRPVIGRTPRSITCRIHVLEILTPRYLAPLMIKYCILLYQIADHPQNILFRYSKKYVTEEDSRP